MRIALTILGLFLLTSHASAAGDDAPGLSAKEIAARLASIQEGTSNVRLKMEVQTSGGTKSELQLQIKQRRTNAATDLIYQVLWPKERQNEAVLLHQSSGHAASGFLVAAPNKPRPLGASQMNEALFGSDLSYEDAVENFFTWTDQTLAGTETVDRGRVRHPRIQTRRGGSFNLRPGAQLDRHEAVGADARGKVSCFRPPGAPD